MFDAAVGAMLRYFQNEGYISHALCVHGYALGIAGGEGVAGRELEILSLAALFHDVGIPVGLKVEGSASGPVQERYGAPKAMELARPFLRDEKDVERVGFLVGHHHSFDIKNDFLLRILFEADWLVNLREKDFDRALIYRQHFVTDTGKRFFRCVYPDAEV